MYSEEITLCAVWLIKSYVPCNDGSGTSWHHGCSRP